MDLPASPRVTIAGGPGRQVDDRPPDLIGTDRGTGRRRRPPRGLVAAIAVATLMGFVAATALAEWRHDRAGELDAATLSVSAWGTGDGGDGGPVSVKDGRPRLRIPVELLNTGPRDVELVSVRLIGTDVVSEDAVGRRLTPGNRARVLLVRPVDCGSEPREVTPYGDVSRLVVRARTDAGEREVEVRAALNTGLLSRQVVIAMCGDLPPDEALQTELTSTVFDGAAALLSLQVGNGSRHGMTVERLRAFVPWLSVRFVDEQRQPVSLPLSLAAGDFSTPRQPWEVRQGQTWWVEISVPDCRRVPSNIAPDGEEPLLGLDVDTGQRSATARVDWASTGVLRELVRTACPS